MNWKILRKNFCVRQECASPFRWIRETREIHLSSKITSLIDLWHDTQIKSKPNYVTFHCQQAAVPAVAAMANVKQTKIPQSIIFYSLLRNWIAPSHNWRCQQRKWVEYHNECDDTQNECRSLLEPNVLISHSLSVCVYLCFTLFLAQLNFTEETQQIKLNQSQIGTLLNFM